LEYLFETNIDEGKGRPCTNAEVLKMSLGELTEVAIGIRSEELGHPTRDQMLARSEAFGVDRSYFTRRVKRQDGALSSLAQEKFTIIMQKALALSQEDRKIVLALLDHRSRRVTV
jgi:hypothetical protein